MFDLNKKRIKMNSLTTQLEKNSNKTRTANGAKAYASTLDANLDYFGGIGALRGREGQALSLFMKAFGENRETALRNLFYGRDIRGGQGERGSFRKILNWLGTNYPEIVKKNLHNIPEYGRWDDLYSLVGTPVEKEALDLFVKQILADIKAFKSGNPVSIAAKWAASENASSSKTKSLARKMIAHAGISAAKYRKALSGLRKEIGIVETMITEGNFSNIDYSKVPSRASLIYRNCFRNKDETRYANFLNKVESGEAKINAGTLYPYDLVNKYRNSIWSNCKVDIDRSVEALWNNLPNYLEGNEHNGLVIADTSGSMSGMPILVCLSLAIYIAERNEGAYKDCFIPFSSDPKFQKLQGQTLAEKVNNFVKDIYYGSTDLVKAFKLVLDSAVEANVPQEEMPTVLYVVSDMQFNSACSSNTRTNFEQIQKMFSEAGYEMPKLVFWNVNGNSNVPITKDDSGAALVSGMSPSIFESVLSGSDPIDVMNQKLYSERYDSVVV